MPLRIPFSLILSVISISSFIVVGNFQIYGIPLFPLVTIIAIWIGLYFRTCGSRNQLFASLSFSFILISLFLINFLLSPSYFSSINVICGTSLIALSPFVGWIFRNLTLSSLAPLSLLVLNISNFISFEVVNQLAGRNVSYRIAVLYFILSFLLNQNLKINILSLASQKPISILNWSFILYFFIRTFSSGSRGGIFTLFFIAIVSALYFLPEFFNSTIFIRFSLFIKKSF